MRIGKNVLKLAAIIGSVVIMVTVLVLAYLGGQEVSLENFFAVGAPFLSGILIMLGLKRSGTVCLLLAFAGASTACQVPAWQYARTTLNAAEGAISASEELVPEDVENRSEAFEIAAGALDLGNRAVDIWESAETEDPPDIWRKAVTALVYASAFVMNLLKTIGVPIPQAVTAAMSAVQFLATMV